MTIRTRFAPSPSGRLHLGHAMSAISAFDFARARGGEFVLRIDDIDLGRSRAEHIETILDDLAWLGLDWDGEPVFQSQRLDRYQAALDRLDGDGLIYPCFCTRAEIVAEIAASASAPHGSQPAQYPGTCRTLNQADLAERVSAPRCWRLDMEQAITRAGPLRWLDAVVGEIDADPAPAGDIVLARKDAPASYHLASTVDDAELGITDVVRGRDLFDATHVQRLLQALLDLPTPRYLHHALVVGANGKRLAKRDASADLGTLRAQGVDGRALADDIRAGRFPTGASLNNP